MKKKKRKSTFYLYAVDRRTLKESFVGSTPFETDVPRMKKVVLTDTDIWKVKVSKRRKQ